jgi:hypothetical protein
MVIGLIIIILAYKILPVREEKLEQKKTDLPFVEHKNSDINNNSVS